LQLSAYTKEFKYNLSMAFPIMMGQLGHVLVGLADNLMIGQLGAAPLAAVSLGNSLVFIALSLGIGFSFAITPLIAEADGASNIEKGRSYFHHGVILCTVNGVLLFLLLLLAKPILYHLDQPPEVVELAIPYLEIVAFSMIPLMIFQAYKQICHVCNPIGKHYKCDLQLFAYLWLVDIPKNGTGRCSDCYTHL